MPISPRLDRELKTITAMVKIYCRRHHEYPATHAGEICEDCTRFLEYAGQRLSHCPFVEHKPTCGNCTVHCYKKAMQAKAKQIMHYAGPRMLWRHPILALCHLVDSRRNSSDLSFCRQEEKNKHLK